MPLRRKSNFVVGHRRVAQFVLGIDGEHDGGHAAFAIVDCEVIERRRAPDLGPEVRGLGRHEVVGKRQVAIRCAFRMRMHIDGDHNVEVYAHAWLLRW